jgi:hypothetical protein
VPAGLRAAGTHPAPAGAVVGVLREQLLDHARLGGDQLDERLVHRSGRECER